MITQTTIREWNEEWKLPTPKITIIVEVTDSSDIVLLEVMEEGYVLFPLTKTGELREERPQVFPMSRIEGVLFEKKLLGKDQWTFEVEGQTYTLQVPHRHSFFSLQREQLKQLRQMME